MKPRKSLVRQLLPGGEAKLDWKRDADRLVIQLFAKRPTQYTEAFKTALAE